MTRPGVHFANWPSWHLAAIPAKSLASHHRTLAGHAGDAIFKVDKQGRKKALAFPRFGRVQAPLWRNLEVGRFRILFESNGASFASPDCPHRSRPPDRLLPGIEGIQKVP